MTKLMEILKKIWELLNKFLSWLGKISDTESFRLCFPMAVFAFGTLAYKSIILGLAFFVWLVPVVRSILDVNGEDTI